MDSPYIEDTIQKKDLYIKDKKTSLLRTKCAGPKVSFT